MHRLGWKTKLETSKIYFDFSLYKLNFTTEKIFFYVHVFNQFKKTSYFYHLKF